MVTRARDLYTFTAANLKDACLVDCGDGLEFFCIGVDPEQRLLLDAVYGILTLRNGVPIGYALFSALWRSSEVAYNVFESFRGGESAWVYGRLLATIRAMFGADTFTDRSVPARPSQRRGPRVGRVVVLLQARIPAVGSGRRATGDERGRQGRRAEGLPHRARRRCGRLVSANLFLQIGPPRRDVIGAIPTGAIGLAVTDYVNARFGTDRERATEELAAEAAARLGVDGWRRWAAGERLFWERWAPLVALMPGLDGWSAAERLDLAAVIRAKGGRRESDFVARFDAHPRLGAALVSLARRRGLKTPDQSTGGCAGGWAGDSRSGRSHRAACSRAAPGRRAPAPRSPAPGPQSATSRPSRAASA